MENVFSEDAQNLLAGYVHGMWIEHVEEHAQARLCTVSGVSFT